MSFLSALNTFGAWSEKELAMIVGKIPPIEQDIAAVLKYAGPALQTVVTLEAGSPAGDVVGKVIADAQAGLVAASSLVYDFGAHPTFASVLSSVGTNLSSLLSAGHVSNPTSVATVTKVFGEVTSLATALAAAPPPAA